MHPLKKYTLSDFQYDLPPELIAKYPARPRDSSRLMVIDARTGDIRHDRFFNISRYLAPKSLLVINDTKVYNAGLRAQRQRDGRMFDFLFLGPLKDDRLTWRALSAPLKRLREGDIFLVASGRPCFVFIGRCGDEGVVRFARTIDPAALLKRSGLPPLPPYIDREVTRKDIPRYQTIYARRSGSCAAPTAGLHFTRRVFATLAEKKIAAASVTLHVGRGTFSPVREEELDRHVMHAEWCSVSARAAGLLNRGLEQGRDIVAVGTTAVRTLETVFDRSRGVYAPASAETKLFIYPPAHVAACRHLITNFHLPGSTLLMLVCAFGGYDLIMKAYREAIRQKYRFYSYGDAMLILRK